MKKLFDIFSNFGRNIYLYKEFSKLYISLDYVECRRKSIQAQQVAFVDWT